MRRIWRHPWMVMMSNLLLVMLLYSVSRAFFYCINTPLFHSVSASHFCEMMLGGMRFDLTAVLYMSSLYMVLMLLPLPMRWRTNLTWQRVCKWIFLVPNLIGLAVNSIDMVYVRFTDRRTTLAFFDEFANDSNLAHIFFVSLFQYWYVTLFFIAVAACLVCLTRTSRYESHAIMPAYVYYPFEVILLCASVYMAVIGIRGGFGAYTRPITLSNALQYTDKPQEAMIVLNTPFSMMRSTESDAYRKPDYYPEDVLDSVFSPVHNPVHSVADTASLPTNVVVIILESFSKEFIGYFNTALDDAAYRGYTPFLDSLCAHSVTFDHSYASGRKSIDAMPSVLSSIPMLITPYILTPYSTNAVSSVADCLRRKGYSTAFFHGAPNGSMGFQAYARSAGFEAYYGMDEYDGPDAFDGTWAIWDEEFLQFYARTMSRMTEPFCTAVFTASSHHPFRVPKRYEGVFDKGTQPLHQCIGYSDNALRLFFSYAAEQPWYSRTLFVITADHTNQLTHDEYTNAKGLYEVPVIFYSPAWDTVPQSIESRQSAVVSQTDIMPSVLQYLHYDEPYFAFGEDALTSAKTHPYAVCYNSGLYQIMSGRLLVQFDGSAVVHVYDCIADPCLRTDLVAVMADDDEVLAMVRYLKAYIQQYISRMIDNRLVAGK